LDLKCIYGSQKPKTEIEYDKDVSLSKFKDQNNTRLKEKQPQNVIAKNIKNIKVKNDRKIYNHAYQYRFNNKGYQNSKFSKSTHLVLNVQIIFILEIIWLIL
jgi:hypothetical protein